MVIKASGELSILRAIRGYSRRTHSSYGLASVFALTVLICCLHIVTSDASMNRRPVMKYDDTKDKGMSLSSSSPPPESQTAARQNHPKTESSPGTTISPKPSVQRCPAVRRPTAGIKISGTRLARAIGITGIPLDSGATTDGAKGSKCAPSKDAAKGPDAATSSDVRMTRIPRSSSTREPIGEKISWTHREKIAERTTKSYTMRPKEMITPVATDQEICGKASRSLSVPRIVGGKNANFHEFPWQALLFVQEKENSLVCGGSIVSNRHIVTAGHCVSGPQPNVTAVLGALDFAKPDAQAEKAVKLSVSKISLHPKYKSFKAIDRYDVAILELERPVKYAGNIIPICLPKGDLQLNKRLGVVTGWGLTSRKAKDAPSRLQKVELPVVELSECKKSYKQYELNATFELQEDQFCAGYPKGGKDTCVGDSGGPFLLSVEGRWTLAGITSGGAACAAPGLPGVYHKVTSSVDWIRKVIAN